MQDALEVQIAHTHVLHVVDGVADVVDAQAALAHALRHQPRTSLQVELAHISRVRRIGEKGERADLAAGAQLNLEQPRRVHAARHLALPKPGERVAHAPGVDAERHAPAGPAAA